MANSALTHSIHAHIPDLHSTRLDRTLVEACCDAVLPYHADDEENNELAAALAARSPLRGRLLVETGVQTSLSLLLPLLLSASASAAQPPSGGVAVADKGVTTEPVVGEEAGTMTDAGPTVTVGTQTTVLALAATEEEAEREEDAAAPPVRRLGSSSGSHPPDPIGPPPSGAPRLCKFDSGLSEDSAPLFAEGGSAGGPLVLVSGDGTEGAHAVGGSGGASSSLLLLGGTPLLPVLGDGSGSSAFLSFFPPPGLSPPSTPPIGHGHGRPAPARAEGSEPLATKQEAAAGPAEEENELGRIGAEEEEGGEEAGGDGAGDGDWAATNLSLGQALKRLRAVSKECAALAADKARLARHLEQMEGTNFLIGAEKERLADEAAHLRAEVARLEKAVRELEEDVEELRLAVKRAEDKAEAYHGALIKERQWHKVGRLFLCMTVGLCGKQLKD